jgi:acyl carrier protein phosphodiesterase
MNWLAHLLLSEPDPEVRLGNILADLVKGKARQSLNYKIQRGLVCHQAADIFTDQHPIVKLSKQRIDDNYRRFAGILIDVFYDYILATSWQNYCSVSLAEFTVTIYNSWSKYLPTLPAYPQGVISCLIAEDWLGSYNSLMGVEKTLARISWKLNRRTNGQYDLTPAIEQLIINYPKLQQDFCQFFPQLRFYLANYYVAK